MATYLQMLEQKARRDRLMYRLRQRNPSKWTFEALGVEFKVSRQRAEQACKKVEKELVAAKRKARRLERKKATEVADVATH